MYFGFSVFGGDIKFKYIYDAAGNRVIKKKIYSNPDRTERDYYVRDTQGNIMAIYSNIYNPMAVERVFVVEEQPIYGSTRLGTLSTGEAFEWDVQLSEQGQKQIGWLSRDGSPVNVSLEGEVTHK